LREGGGFLEVRAGEDAQLERLRLFRLIKE